MRIYTEENYAGMCRRAAGIIASQMILKPDSVLGLATGSTPVGIYEQLIAMYQSGLIDFSDIKTVNLDEYRGLAKDDDHSYHSFMEKNLFSHVNLKDENTIIPDGLAVDEQAECRRYENEIAAMGGVDLQLLGIGHNGHIGFNEPDTAFEPAVHSVSLSRSTIEANKRFFHSAAEVPERAYTMGIRTIMQASTILIVASGADKAEIVARAFLGPVSPEVPASILQLHPDVILAGDQNALHLLK